MTAPLLLHGDLHVTIYEVDNLHMGDLHHLFHKIAEGVESLFGFGKRTHKLYATVDIGQARVRVGRTRTLEEQSNPRWLDKFHIYCGHTASEVVFSVKVTNPVGAVVIGRSYIAAADLVSGEEIEEWLPILDADRKPIHGNSKLLVKVQFFDIARQTYWSQGLKSPNFDGVPFTYFPQRNDCRITLYQDAHSADSFVPPISLAGGKMYEVHRCWEDIFHAINGAKHFIYIAGWSVYAEISLMRDPRRSQPGETITLGELLKKKADEGIRVLLLVWDDRTSVPLINKDGLMATHDSDTSLYFHDTQVHCVLCPRNPDNGSSLVQDIEIGTMFTHHQKTVIVDAEVAAGNQDQRRIISFVGGIDLCDGRYDTQSHSLFRTLNTVHRDDFHQANFERATIKKGGPREPWHDIHCRIEGSAAWDVLHNFEQRWQKQGGRDLLLPLHELQRIIIPPSPVMSPDDPETWNVQVFRSIDAGAAFGFPESPEEAAKSGLISGKDHIIERSIQDAYIHAIRRANKFIYIENQYFLGSSFSWNSKDIKDVEIGALHLIPKELSLKIVSKIEAGEEFRVYIVVPMWPEGFPESSSVQAILDWQRRTMQMMYRDVASALEAKDIQANLKDYLTFFCLGNRELKEAGEYVPPEKPEPNTGYARAQAARRAMIYVHAKTMMVDDEYIIVGSANINQRSMDGGRDTEIAMGAYQPYHLSGNELARGAVHGFRMSLWYEHTGTIHDCFLQPESLECIQTMNDIGKQNWELFASDNLDADLPGQLLSYPIEVEPDGTVNHLPGTKVFPDTNAPILGTLAEFLPPILTT